MTTLADRPRMRIAFVTDALVPYSDGGAERRVHELATRLAERHEVHVVTWSFWGDAPAIKRGGVTFHGVGRPRPFYGPDGRRTVREGVAFAARVPRALARLHVDVVDVSATPYLPVFGAWLGTRVSGTPLVATWHEYWGEYWGEYLGGRPIVARAARIGEWLARGLADRRIAVSQFTAARLAGGSPAAWPSDIVGNGVAAATLAKARPDPHRSDVIFVGRLIEEKGVGRLLGAIAWLTGELPGIRCVIVGEGPDRARLEAGAAALGLADRVAFLGRVEEGRVARLLRASKVLVLPSAREGYGIAVVEAQAAGVVPIVVRSPLSAAPDQVEDGRDGLLCEPTEGGIGSAIAMLLGDRPRLRRMSAAAKRSGAARDWDRRVEEIERVYLQAIAAKRTRSRTRMSRVRVAAPPPPSAGDAAREPAEAQW